MNSSVSLYSVIDNEIKKFLSLYYEKDIILKDNLKWTKPFENPIEIAEMIGTFIDNNDKFNINMWISLDEGIFINVTDHNADNIIRYLYERYPY